MTEIQLIFLSFHFVTWFMLGLVYMEIQSWKKEIRQHIDYDNSLKAMRRKERRNSLIMEINYELFEKLSENDR